MTQINLFHKTETDALGELSCGCHGGGPGEGMDVEGGIADVSYFMWDR